MLGSTQNALKTLIKRLEPYIKTDLSYFIKSSFWLNAVSIFGAILSFVLSILFAQYVSKDTYGIYKFILSVAGLASALSLTGMNVAVMRSVAQGHDGIFRRSLIEQIRWSWPQIAFSLIAGIYYFYNSNTVYGICFLIISVLGPISSIGNTFVVVLYGKKDFRTSALYGMISNLLYFLGMLAVIIGASDSIILLIIGYYGLNTISNVYFSWRTYRKYHSTLSRDDYREEDITYAKHLSFMNTIGILATHADNVLVYYMLGPASLALYSFATILPERIRVMFGFIASAAFPKIAERDQSTIGPTTKRKIWQLILLALLIAMAYIMTAPYIFKVFYPQYESVVLYSQIFSLSLVAIASNISVTALQAHRKQKELYVISFGVPIIKMLTSLIGIYFFGILGAVVAKILHHVTLLASSSYYLQKENK